VIDGAVNGESHCFFFVILQHRECVRYHLLVDPAVSIVEIVKNNKSVVDVESDGFGDVVMW